MKKRISAIIMSVLAAAMLAGCADNSTSTSGGTAGTVGTADTSASVSDSGTPSDASESTADAPADSADTPFAQHGALSVNGADLVDADGEKFQLYGMSTHGIDWFPQYVSEETFDTLRNDWGTNCIRLSMYTAESGGYCTDGNKENLKTLVKNGVDYATALGMYVIIDWHVLREENPMTYKDEAVAFFDEMSALYADRDNIIYEICNEPNGSGSWEQVTQYANEVIPVIRANDANSVILVGTPTWSQDIDKALADPLSFDNIMYTVHFYAATHKEWLRDRAQTCIDSGLPIFVSEFGICDASGNGGLDYDSAEAWKELIDSNNLSFFCWNLANNNESSSVIKAGNTKLSGWTDDELSDQGKWVTAWFKSKNS